MTTMPDHDPIGPNPRPMSHWLVRRRALIYAALLLLSLALLVADRMRRDREAAIDAGVTSGQR